MLLKKNKQGGLSIVELFIVVALLGLALSIVSTSFMNAKKKARDTRRILDVAEVSQALNIFYVTAQRFPIIQNSVTIDGHDPLSKLLLEKGALQHIPLDPSYPTYGYYYISNKDGSDFILTYCLETNLIREQFKGCNNIIRP